MKRIFLLRAYGDFIVALQSLFHSTDIASYELIASLHHRPLFEALPASLIPANVNIRFVDFGIDGPMLRAFTNRHILNGATMRELKALTDFCKQNPTPSGGDFIENTHRKWILETGTGIKFNAIAGWSDVYKNNHDFFKTVSPTIQHTTESAKKILVLPSARIPKRDIPESVIQHITQSHQDQIVDIAYFKEANFKEAKQNSIVYNNFSELVQLIEHSDYIYGADSLPIHLSYLLQKPHAIVYPAGGSHQFFTPFAIEQKAHFTFNHFN